MQNNGVTPSNRESVYFPNLNSLRFVAVLLVFVHHVQQLSFSFLPKEIMGKENAMIHSIGPLGVRLFFVLSGFLITYLLCVEKQRTSTINIKKFYIRRALRIWPLYYLTIILAFFILPLFPALYSHDDMSHTMHIKEILTPLSLYLVFLPNIVLYVSGIIPFISQTWSIGTEEQFYFIWPVLFKKIKNKYLLLSSIIVLYTIIRYTLAHLPANYTVNLLIFFWSAFPIDNMAIGGLFAVMIHDQDKISLTLKSIVFHKATQILTTILLIVSLVWGLIVPYFLFEYYSVLFGIIIVNLAANDRRLINIEFSFLKYLGKISYGLYMYHSLAIAITLSVMIHFNQTSNFILYPVALLLTILLSEISYTYFEQRFIKKKRKFSVVVSGDNVEEK